MNNISNINVTPRKIEGKIGKHSYEITYDPSERVWKWVAHVSVTYDLTGTHKSRELAEAAVKKAVTKFLKTNEDLTV